MYHVLFNKFTVPDKDNPLGVYPTVLGTKETEEEARTLLEWVLKDLQLTKQKVVSRVTFSTDPMYEVSHRDGDALTIEGYVSLVEI
jgi:hypothetical protein